MSGLEALPTVLAAELSADDTDESARWLVRALWGEQAVGILGGAPKCCKSWMALELAVAVSSGTPALDCFEVPTPGPALVYMAEDALSIVRDRISSLCAARELSLQGLPLHVITVPVLRLDHEIDRRRLERSVAEIRPRLLILDPIVRLHRVDENRAGDVSGLLAFLRTLQRLYDVSVLVVHHARKSASARPGQALRGSGDFHAWGDSNLYLSRRAERLTLTVEHRAAPTPDPMDLQLRSEPAVHLALADDRSDHVAAAHDQLEERVVAAVRRMEPVTLASLQGHLRVRRARLSAALDSLLARRHLVRTDSGWTVPDPPP